MKTFQNERDAGDGDEIHLLTLRYNALLANRITYIVHTDANHFVLSANPAFCEAAGTDFDSLKGKPLQNFFLAEDMPIFEKNIHSLLHPPYIASGRNRIVLQGLTYWLDWEAQAILDPAGQPAEIQYVAYNLEDLITYQRKLEKSLNEAGILTEIRRNLNQDLDPKLILAQIIQAVKALVPHADHAVLHTYQKNNQVLLPVSVAGMTDLSNPSLLMSAGEGIAGAALAQRTPVNCGDTNLDPRYLANLVGIDVRSLLVVPILSGDQVLGTISVQSYKPYAFTDEDENTLSHLSTSAALALKNAYLFEKEKTQRQVLQAISKSETPIHLSRDLDKILDEILEYVVIYGPCTSANIMLIEESSIKMVRHTGYEAYLDEPYFLENISFPLNTPKFHQMIQTGRGLWIPDVSNDPEWIYPPISNENPMRSYAAAPLKLNEQVIGFINVDSLETYQFDESFVSRLEFFASQVSLNLHNAWLQKNLLNFAKSDQENRKHISQLEKLASLGRLVSKVVHEIDNPLQSLHNCLFILKEESDDMPGVDQFFSLALEEVNRLTQIVDELRKGFKNAPEIHITPVDAQAILARIKILVSPEMEKENIRWVQAEDPPEVWIQADTNQLTQVLLNLVINAVEAVSGCDGELQVDILLDEPSKLGGIRIRDNGAGIPFEHLDQIFDQFFTTKETGLGMGLAICKEIIARHQGRIEVDNRPGEGAAFTIWLPLAKPPKTNSFDQLR